MHPRVQRRTRACKGRRWGHHPAPLPLLILPASNEATDMAKQQRTAQRRRSSTGATTTSP
uniref:Uncharacterized protein n=1 Tax=Oryza nivara TaxID=4536 RepID=A0A0E0IZQ7_ORYNI